MNQTGTTSASVTQTCTHPAGFTFETGTSSATAAYGSVSASTVFGSFISFPRGSASAEFIAPMQIASGELGPLFLTFRVHYTGTVNNHAESSAFAQSRWTIDGDVLGAFAGPGTEPTGTVNTFVDYTAPLSYAAGDTFVLRGAVETNARDYYGHAVLAADLVGIQVRNAAGDLVAADVTFVPEPATVGVAGVGLLVLFARRRLTVS